MAAWGFVGSGGLRKRLGAATAYSPGAASPYRGPDGAISPVDRRPRHHDHMRWTINGSFVDLETRDLGPVGVEWNTTVVVSGKQEVLTSAVATLATQAGGRSAAWVGLCVPHASDCWLYDLLVTID
jgi:hypothetical protein